MHLVQYDVAVVVLAIVHDGHDHVHGHKTGSMRSRMEESLRETHNKQKCDTYHMNVMCPSFVAQASRTPAEKYELVNSESSVRYVDMTDAFPLLAYVATLVFQEITAVKALTVIPKAVGAAAFPLRGKSELEWARHFAKAGVANLRIDVGEGGEQSRVLDCKIT